MDEATTHLRLLRHKDASVRITAIKALGKLDPVDSIIIDSLARTLEDNDPSVREAAAQVLGEISNRQIQTSISGTEKRKNPALSRLVHIVLHDMSVKVRLAAVEALLKIGEGAEKFTRAHYTPPPYPVLTTGHSDIWEPDSLYYQLPDIQKLIEDYVFPALMAAMEDQNPDVRKAAESLSINLPKHMVEKIQQVNVRQQLIAAEQAMKDTVQFSAYYPREVQINDMSNLYVYTHLGSQLREIQENALQIKAHLGEEIPQPKTANQSIQLMRGTSIMIVPECDAIKFFPSSLAKRWDGDWIRFDFAFKPKLQSVDEPYFIRVSIQTNGLDIAHIDCPINIVKRMVEPKPINVIPQNPIATAKLAHQMTKLYEKIFVSYSRKDAEVVEAYRLAQLARGDDVFMDTYSIKPGEGWQAALALAIDTADIFQLFWSKNSATSPNICDEWNYALKHRCPETKCVGFIRPVFWDKPMIPPPEELSHLNFRYVPLPHMPKLSGGVQEE